MPTKKTENAQNRDRESWLAESIEKILKLLKDSHEEDEEIERRLDIIEDILKGQGQQLQDILSALGDLGPPLPVGFTIAESIPGQAPAPKGASMKAAEAASADQVVCVHCNTPVDPKNPICAGCGNNSHLEINRRTEKTMKAVKATADLQILDSGKGVLYTLTPVDKAGDAVPLPAGVTVTASSSAPASLANAIPDPGDSTIDPPRPPDTTGLVFLATVPQPPVDATGIVMTFSAPFGSTAADPVDVTADNSPVGFTITETAE